jgi:uncharacterized protein (UPF0333 family)
LKKKLSWPIENMVQVNEMEEKAQVNLEYLLIIAGAVVIATAVGLFIKQSASSVTRSAQEQAAEG